MIFVDKPFASDFLKETIEKYDIPLVQTDAAEQLGFADVASAISPAVAIQKAQTDPNGPIYTNSENSIGWIAQHLPFSDLPQKIDLFKDKVKFRTLARPMYPDFYFQEVKLDDIDQLSLEGIPLPFIIKPAVGFFSMGVYRVTDPENWEQTKEALKSEINAVQNLYPTEVLNTVSLIIEECIEGEEFAFDAYFDSQGEPVILNIYQHVFSSADDVSDRIYMTSKQIIEAHIEPFSEFLKMIGTQVSLQNFPVHVELRRDSAGSIIPIEVNPMRFGGWCTTADMTYFAFGLNPYQLFFDQERPDWSQALQGKEGKLYSIIVLDNSTGVDGSQISHFDYEQLRAQFENPLELRQIDYKAYPVFGFVFAETREEHFAELERILQSDLSEFITQNTNS